MEFRLLGPFDVIVDGDLVPLGGAKPRALLAALVLQRGRVVPVGRLVDLIWGPDPPETARAVVQTYVKNLRHALARLGVTDVIVTRAPGYLAQVPADAVDREVFEGLLAESRRTGGAEAARLLRRAEALWHGPALAGLGDTGLAGEAARLDELRLTAIQERIGAELELGRSDQLAELTELVDRHPTNERLRAHLMTVLYRAGRQADALASFRRGRDLLAEELGVEPGAELTRLRDAILVGRLPVLGSPGVPPPVRVPAQLPPVLADFTGRAAELASLRRPGGAAVRVVSGPGGIGKSALASRAAADLASSFPDGQLFADLRGTSETPATPVEVLVAFLRGLGMVDDHIPDTLDECAALFRSRLAGRRMLVLLDDARDERQVRPLVPGGPWCRVIATSRDRLAGLDGAALIELDALEPDEATALLTRIVGASRVRSDPESARRILEHCGNLPLAIRLAGARLVSRRCLPLRVLADRLADESQRLTELSYGDRGVRASIQPSYRGLDPVAKTAIRRLGYLGIPDFSLRVVGWLMDMSRTRADALAEALVDARLVDYVATDPSGIPRYRMDDLVRLFARERAEAEDRREDLASAVARALSGGVC